MFIVGGTDGSRPLDDLWSLDLAVATSPRWRRIPATGLPASPSVASIGLVWDTPHERLVAFVRDGDHGALEAWALEVGASSEWRPFCVRGVRARTTGALLAETPEGPTIVGASSGALYRFDTSTPLCPARAPER